MESDFYSSPEWRALRERVRQRDADRCTVSRLLGGECGGLLHAHHLDPFADPLDIDNCGTACQVHHPKWEALRRSVVAGRRREWKRCHHRHRYAHARAECERKLNGLALTG